ncbi:RDD family protein [Streptomyces sp. NPDC006529]|uniref:RDD family protein n=1 Tax=Streptomyces sp. NPDC006529 TaxID=3157177 RepID=UPI0033A1E44E
MTASPGDGGHAAREGYYPDPSIPGYVRYWNGGSWVPGTSRPAPVEETGPVFLDETSMTAACREPEPVPEPVAVRAPAPEPMGWQADPLHQAGFGGPRDHLVSWGQADEHGHEAAGRQGGVSFARSRPEPLPEAEPESRPEYRPEPRWEPAREPVREPAAVRGSASGVRIGRAPEEAGILSARSPLAPAAPAPAPDWPEPRGSGGIPAPSTASASTPAASAPARSVAAPSAPASAPAPAPDPAGAAVPAPAAHAPVHAPAMAAARAVPAGPEAATGTDAPAPAPRRTDSDVFERMAERAVRPAGRPRRLLARLVDSLVPAGVAVAVARPLLPAVTAHLDAKVEAARGSGHTVTVWLLDGTTAGYLGVVLGAVLLCGVFCEVLPTARWGRTPGKKLFGIRVLAVATRRPPSFGAALRRWLVYALLGVPGSLWCLVDRPRRQAWHDKAAGTYVAR